MENIGHCEYGPLQISVGGMALTTILQPWMRGSNTWPSDRSVAAHTVVPHVQRMGYRWRQSWQESCSWPSSFNPFKVIAGRPAVSRDLALRLLAAHQYLRHRACLFNMALRAVGEQMVAHLGCNFSGDRHAIAMTCQATLGRTLINRMGNRRRSGIKRPCAETIAERFILHLRGSDDSIKHTWVDLL